MADRKITDLTALTTPASADVLPIVDVSEAAAADKNKKVTVGELFKGIPDGTAAAPAIAFESDDGNGLFLSTTDTIGISTNGVSRATVSTTAVTSTLPISATAFSPTSATVPTNGVYLPATNSVGIATNGSAAITIDSSQRVGIGTSSVNALLEVNSSTAGNEVQRIEGSYSGAGSVTLTNWRRAGGAVAAAFKYNDGTSPLCMSIGTTTAHQFRIRTADTDAITIDSSQRVGVGTTSPGYKLDVSGPASAGSLQPIAQFVTSSASGAGSGGYIDIGWNPSSTNAGAVARIGGVATGSNATELTFGTSSSISSAPTERARIDSSGRLLVGTTTSRSNFFASIASQVQIEGTSSSNSALSITRNSNDSSCGILYLAKTRSGSVGGNTVVAADDQIGLIAWQGADGTNLTSAAYIEARVDGTPGTNDMPGRLVFSVTRDGDSSPTESARINNAGFFKATSTGTYNNATGGYHELRTGTNASQAFLVTHTNSDPYGVEIIYTTASPNGTTNWFLNCADSSATRATIRSNGGLANYSANNVNLSDVNTKKDITPADDTWDCIKEWEIVNFRYKDQPDNADLNMGVIAQQVAESCPEVITVFEEAIDDQPEKLGVKEQQMMWMAIKALQEAQVRIEALEAEVAALKGA